VNHRPAAERDAKILSEPLATRVLSRASELDAALRAGASVAELRRAALEAGISAEAFEAALAELDDAGARVPDVNAHPHSRRRRWILAAVIAVMIVVGASGIMLRRTPPVSAAPIVEEAFLLRCLSPGQAAELIRPLLRLAENSVVYSSEHAPRVLTVGATPAQMRDVRSLLDRYEGPAACAAGAAR
jgi:hypothetical protein